METKRTKSGFTLLELSIVLLILSLMLGGILAALTQESRRSQKAQLQTKMDAIEQALLSYARRSDAYALPCPAVVQATGSASFGVRDTAADCTNLPLTDGSAATGLVPVVSLGLDTDYAYDPWGNFFMYTVSVGATTTSSLSTTYPTSSSLGNLTVNDTAGNSITTTAVAALVSTGPDGFGAYTREGTRKSAYSTNAMQLENAKCKDSTCSVELYPTSFYVGSNTTQDPSDTEAGFDDTVRYYGREFFLLSKDMVTEKP